MAMPQDEPMDQAREKAYSTPLAEFDMADPELFQSNSMWPYFERMRKEDPDRIDAYIEEFFPNE